MATLPIKLFLSYCRTDEAYADDLYNALKAKERLVVWRDKDVLQPGDSLVSRIHDGLTNCNCGLILLSTAYIDSAWCNTEYKAMVNLATTEKFIMIPIMHGISFKDVTDFSVFLRDTIALNSDRPLNEVVSTIEGVALGVQKAREIGDPLHKDFSELADDLADHDANERLSRSEQGVSLVQQEVFHLFDVFEKRLDQIQGSIPFQKYRRDRPTNYRHHYPAVGASGRFRINVEIGYLNSYANATAYAKLVITLFAWPDDTPPQLAELYGHKEEILRKLFAPRFRANEKVRWKNDEDASNYTSEQVVGIALTLFKEQIALRLKQGISETLE